MDVSVSVGIIGCGNISQAYFNGLRHFPIIKIVGCADIKEDVARKMAHTNGVKSYTIDELLKDPSIDIIINLTTPQFHAQAAENALNAGKHTYCEKPLAVELEDGKKVVSLAHEKGLRIGSAPDTVLGSGIQTCRKLIDDGQIGDVIAGTAFMQIHGHESWHPNPEFYYLNGGGPLFDMGPYYLTALVNLLGPIDRVVGMTSKGFKERICSSESRKGDVIPVEINTHIAGNLLFKSGAIISIVMSFDIWGHTNKPLELHGSLGSLQIPDPNRFSGPIKIKKGNNDWQDVAVVGHYQDNFRGIGVAEMAFAIENNREHRCNGDIALHVLEVMHAFEKSMETERQVVITSEFNRPQYLSEKLPFGIL